MSESAGVRRSSRRREKKGPAFKVGDIVEINRSRGRSKGRLVCRLTEESATRTRWLIAFDDESSWKEEEMYETAFGSIIGKAGPSKPLAPPVVKTSTKRTKKQRKTSAASTADSQPDSSTGPKSSITSSSPSQNGSSSFIANFKQSPAAVSSPDESVENAINGNEKTNKKKRKSSDLDPQTAAEPPSDSSDAKNAAAAARAARSLRRQAKLEEEHTKRMLHHEPPPKKAKTEKDSNVVRVPMLTGTLILYRGPRRRAQFVFNK